MKAFLSHSSKDKAIVNQVADQLGLANVELDSETFDRGILNTAAIQAALNSSSLFVLFLSQNALKSGIIRYEAMLAQDLFSRGLLERFLVICLDEDAFASADANWKAFNFVRKAVSPRSIARLIQHNLILLRSKASSTNQPFVGRAKELHDIKERFVDPLLSRMRGIYVSGFTGLGRHTFAKRLFRDLYPSVISVFPEIAIEKLDGYDEIYRKLIDQLSPTTTLSGWRTRVFAFAAENDGGKARLIAELLERLVESREAIYVADHGGLLDDQGAFQLIMRNIIERVKLQRRPYLIFIADRMVPYVLQKQIEGIIYCRLPPLTPDETKQLLGLKLRDADMDYSPDELAQLADLCDGHPFNAGFLVEAVKHYGLALVLGDPSEIVQWKRRRASDFLTKIAFTQIQQLLLGALKLFNVLNLDVLVRAADSDGATVSSALMGLIDYHIVEAEGDAFSISSPLSTAVDRDRRFELSRDEQGRILRVISEELTAKRDTDEISASMIDAAILARLQEGGDLPSTFSALLLPSHLVWLARRRYDEKRLEDCIVLARSALDAIGRLSPAGIVEACRVLCLSAARRNQQEDFKRGSGVLRASASDAWARSNLNFLFGFNARMRGRLPEAENFFRASYEDSPGNFSAAHEIASICLARGNLTDAESFARQAFESAPDNAYVLDILLRVLMTRDQQEKTKNDQEIELLFERLKLVGEEEGRSFYTTRRAEYELKFGSIDQACKMIDDAVSKTPGIFNVHALRAEIYLERGNKVIARDEVNTMRGMVYRHSSLEQLSNLRPFLEIEAAYYLAIEDYEKAKGAYRTEGYSPELRRRMPSGALKSNRDLRAAQVRGAGDGTELRWHLTHLPQYPFPTARLARRRAALAPRAADYAFG